MKLERSIEKYLDDRARALDGWTAKLNPVNKRGIPDRLVVLPFVPPFFVEMKRPQGGKVAELQKLWHRSLTAKGQTAYYAYTEADVDRIIGAALEAQTGNRHREGGHGDVPRNA